MAGRVVVNERAAAYPVRQHDAEEVLAFHRAFPGYTPTRLVDAPSIAERLGVAQVLVKDESTRMGMPAFKILGASWATYRALCERTGLDRASGLDVLRQHLDGVNLTLVAATDGNHGRAVARMAKLLGLRAHMLVPHDMVPARIEALRSEGAHVTVVPGSYDEAVAASALLEGDTHLVVSETSWEGYTRVPGWVIEGYATIPAEVAEQAAAPPTVVAAQIGVGALAAALVRAYAGTARVIGVEPVAADCAQASLEAGKPVPARGDLRSIMAGLNCGTVSPLAWPELRDGVAAFVTVEDEDAEEAMRVLAHAGVESGESGAAGLAGLLAHAQALELSPDDRVLVISTEGATDPEGYERIIR